MTQKLIGFISAHYYIIFYLVALIVSILMYRKYFDTDLKYFPLLIAYTFFNELLGYFIRYNENFAFFSDKEFLGANDIIYTIYELVFFSFFYVLYWRLVRHKKFKKWIFWSSALVAITYIINGCFENPLIVSLYYSTALASWVLLFHVILYLINLGKDLKWELQKHNLMFWVTIGLGLFYFFFPVIYLTGFLNFDIWQQYHLRTILRILIVIMYVLFCIGFIKSRRRAFR